MARGRRTAGGKREEQESAEGMETKRKNRLLGSDGLVRFPSCKVSANGRFAIAWSLPIKARQNLTKGERRKGAKIGVGMT